MEKKAWYALRVQSEREEKIKESLIARIRAKGLEQYVSQIVVPAENVSEIKEGKKRVSQQKMFPGYILIELQTNDGGEVPEGVWFAIMETPGISGFVGGNRMNPVPLDEMEVRRILSDIESRKEKPKPKVEFEPGNKVRIKEGPFENFDGTVESVDSTKWMLKVKVSIFGRDTAVEMEYGKVEENLVIVASPGVFTPGQRNNNGVIMAKKEIKAKVKLQCPAGGANPAPPVGPALSQHGVNIGEFVKRFKAETAKQKGMIIPVIVTVYLDKSVRSGLQDSAPA